MPPTTIATTAEQIRRAIRSRVATADALGTDWTEQPDVHCDELQLRAAPGLDSCLLSYVYGPIRRETGGDFEQYDRLDLLGKFVRVTLEGAQLDGGDVVWYGLLEVDDNTPHGSQGTADIPRGEQRFTAYGLLRLLERTIVDRTTVDDSQNQQFPTDSVELEYGLPYNLPDALGPVFDGNKTADRQLGNPNLPYWFSRLFSVQDRWTPAEAVEHLLHWHPPVDSTGENVVDCQLDDAEGLLGDTLPAPPVNTDLRSVKSILDEMIPFRRGLSYTVTYTETGAPRGVLTVKPFSFAKESLEYGVDTDGEPLGYLRTNPNQYELDFENAIDVRARVVESFSTTYDAVVAYGEFATSTCTLAFGKTESNRGNAFQIVPDWTPEQQQQWLDASQSVSGYGSLSVLKQFLVNMEFRNSDKLLPVWRRFRLYPFFDNRVSRILDSDLTGTKYWVNPPWPTDGDLSTRDTDPFAEPLQPWRASHTEARVAWSRIQFEPQLPLFEGVDYSGDKIADGSWKDSLPDGFQQRPLRPLLLAETANEELTGIYTRSFRRVDVMAENAGNEQRRARFSVTCQFGYPYAALDLVVHGAPQWFLATQFAGSMGYLDPIQDPSKEGGIDYTDLRGTFTLRLPWRAQHRVQIGDDLPPGRQQRVLHLPVAARLDYVVPDTVVGITAEPGDSGAAKCVFSSGGFVRDDRDRLRRVAQAAAAWYGARRQTLALSIQGVVGILQVGDLIASVGGRYTLEDVNTPVTAVRFNLLEQTTELETSMLEVDFT